MIMINDIQNKYEVKTFHFFDIKPIKRLKPVTRKGGL